MRTSSQLVLAVAILLVALAAGVVLGPIALPTDGGQNEPSAAAGTDAGDPGTDEVEVVGGEFESDPDELFQWTTDAMNQDPAAPTVRIGEIRPSGHPIEGREFQQLLILDDPDADLPERPMTARASEGRVVVNEQRLEALQDPDDPPHEDDVLVHEFTHVVQIDAGYSPNAGGNYGVTLEHDFARAALIEGGAEYVADEYAEGAVMEQWEEDWAQLDAERRLVRWPYYRGAEYVDARVDDPAEILELRRPPTTGEMLRGEEPAADPPRIELAIDHDADSIVGHDRLGAATVEVALSKELSVDRSRDVAAGLRADRYRPHDLDSDGEYDGYAWATQWQDAAAADAFEDAMTDYLDARGNVSGDRWTDVGGASFRLERPDDRTVAVIAGPDGFVGNTTITGADGEYAVEKTGSAGARSAAGALAPSPTGAPTAEAVGA